MAKLLNTVSVYGTDWKIYKNKNLVDCDGICKPHAHEIHIRPAKRMVDGGTEEENTACYRFVMRHELVHAFFNSAGLVEYAYDEKLVDAIAHAYPHMQKLFQELGCDKE